MQSKRSYKLKTTKTNDVEKNFVSTVSEVHTIYRAMPQKEEGATARSGGEKMQTQPHTLAPKKHLFINALQYYLLYASQN
jgi:hypothetical protein